MHHLLDEAFDHFTVHASGGGGNLGGVASVQKGSGLGCIRGGIESARISGKGARRGDGSLCQVTRRFRSIFF